MSRISVPGTDPFSQPPQKKNRTRGCLESQDPGPAIPTVPTGFAVLTVPTVPTVPAVPTGSAVLTVPAVPTGMAVPTFL